MKNKEIDWVLGSKRMPIDFNKLYVLKYVYKDTYTDGFKLGSFATLCMLGSIDSDGYRFRTYSDVSITEIDNEQILKIHNQNKDLHTETIIRFGNLDNVYWSEIVFDSKIDEIERLEREKVELQEKLKNIEHRIEEANKENNTKYIDITICEDMNLDLKKKFDSMMTEAKEQGINNGWIESNIRGEFK